VTILS